MAVNLSLDRLHHIARSHLLLLDALLLPEPEAGQAFLRWLQSVDLDKADFATYRLIPAVYARHAQAASHLSDYGRMKGIYRYFHVKNTLLMADARQAVEALHATGIEVVALKGLAWGLKFYDRNALRVMLDADLLVSREHFERAVAVLRDLGWQYRHSDQHRRIFDHSIDFTNASGRALDLHVRSLAEVHDPAFDRLVFAQSPPHEGSGPPMRAPRAEHLVLIGLVNAVREPEQFRLEWIYDLARALAASPSFDWLELCQLSHAYGVAGEVFDALLIATDLPGLGGLRKVLPRLARRTPSPEEFEQVADDAPQPRARAAAQHMRVFEDDRGNVEALFLHWDQLSLAPSLFEITDETTWQETLRGLPTQGAGLIDVAPGLLKRRSGKIESYRASIEFADGGPPKALASGAAMIVPLRIVNRSAEAWTSYGATDFSYGVSWHVYQANGDPAVWDRPRYYFLVPKEKYLVFVAPGMAVDCPLEFIAPEEPGDYIIKLDIVHEGVSWFASPEHPLPEWRISVVDLQPPPGVEDQAPDDPASDARAVAWNLRLFENERGEIEALFLRWQHLSFVPHLFDILDPSAWEETVRGLPMRGAGLLNVAPGLLKRRSSRLESYRATVEFSDGDPPAELAPGASVTVRLRIANEGVEAWTGYGAEDFQYGVSWHEYLADGEPVVWDRPRYYFLTPRDKYLTFVAPGMAVDCPLTFTAPTAPGDYLIRLDVVHEGVSWFVTPEHRLPEWRLSVTAPPTDIGRANEDGSAL